jgi:hypothetical protein
MKSAAEITTKEELTDIKNRIKDLDKRNGRIEIEYKVRGGNAVALVENLKFDAPKTYKVTYYDSVNDVSIRKIEKDKSTYYEHKLKSNISLSQYPITVGISSEKRSETSAKRSETSAKGVENFNRSYKEMVVRDITRYSVVLERIYENNLKLDISRVDQTDIATGTTISLNEVEIDYTMKVDVSSSNMQELIERIEGYVYKVMLALYDSPYLVTKQRTSQLIKDVIEAMEISIFLAKGHNKGNFDESDIRKTINTRLNTGQEYVTLDDRYFIKPIDLQISDLIGSKGKPGIDRRSGFSVMYKTDGTRGTMYFTSDGVYTFSSGRSFRKLSCTIYKNLIGVILEVEYILAEGRFVSMDYAFGDAKIPTYECYVFDVMAYPDAIKRERDGYKTSYYLDRLRIAEELVSSTKLPEFDIKFKKHKEFSDKNEFFAVMREFLDNIPADSRPSQRPVSERLDQRSVLERPDQRPVLERPEGLILTSLVTSPDAYSSDLSRSVPVIYKWKFEMTIDFVVKSVKDKSGSKLIPYVSTGDELVPFAPDDQTFRIAPSGRIFQTVPSERIIPVENYKDRYIRFGVVGEFAYSDGIFKFVRTRSDKLKPNSINTAINVWKLLQKPVSKEVLLGKSLMSLWSLHNKVKSLRLFDSISRELKNTGRIYLVDIGSGKGGDVSKWVNMISSTTIGYNRMMLNVIAIEKGDVTELTKRLILVQGQINAHIINGDATGKSIPEQIGDIWEYQKANVITMFHSLSLIYKSEAHAERLLDNMAKISGAGTVVKIVSFDAASYIKDKSINIGDSNRGDLIKIRYESIDTINIKFKESASVDIEGQDEYIVDFDDLILRLRYRGFEIVSDEYVIPRGYIPDEAAEYSSYNRMLTAVYSDVPANSVIAKLISLDERLGLSEDTKQRQRPSTPPKNKHADSGFSKNEAIKQVSKFGEDKVRKSRPVTPPPRLNLNIQPKDKSKVDDVNVSPNRSQELKLISSKNKGMLKVGESQYINVKIISELGLDAIRIGTDATGDCFFAAILTSTHDKFTKANAMERERLIKEMRSRIAGLATKYISNLFDGNAYESLRIIASSEYGEEHSGNDDILKWFKNHIKTPGEYVGSEMYQLTSIVYDINIFIFTDKDRLYAEFNRSNIKKYYNLDRPSIILLYMSASEHYESIGVLYGDNDLRLQFKPHDVIPEALYNIMLNKSSPEPRKK